MLDAMIFFAVWGVLFGMVLAERPKDSYWTCLIKAGGLAVLVYAASWVFNRISVDLFNA